MTAIWLRARSELRSRLPAVVALALIVGVIGGVVIAAAAGARRTETSYPRFVEAKNGLDVVVDAGASDAATAERLVAQAVQLPQVEQSSRVFLVPGGLRIPGRKAPANVFPLVSPDGRFGTTINGVKILEGRMYNSKAPNEIVPSFGVAADVGLHVGDNIRLVCCGVFGKPNRDFSPSPTTLHVVGIGAAPGMFQPLAGGYLPGVFLSPAFYRIHHDWIDETDQTAALVLHRGLADVQAFVEGIRQMREHLRHGHIGVPFNQAQQTVGVQQATRAQSISMWVLAGLVALAGLAVFAQALARQTFLESTEYPTLRSVGMSPSQLMAIGMIRAAAIGVIAAVVAAVVGFLLSPLTPTGFARLAEPDPGFALDVPVVFAGAAATALLVVLLSAIPAWRASRVGGTALGTAELPGSRRPSAIATLMARSAFPPSATAGVRMAMEPGRGRTAVPVRTTMFGASLSILALAAALVFGASLDRLTATPRLAGYTWDVLMFPDGQGPKQVLAQDRKIESIMDRSPQVSGYAVGSVDNIKVGRLNVLALSLDPHKGSVVPALAQGRLPGGVDEVALGGTTMSKLGVGVGDSVSVSNKDIQYSMRVVGRVAIPPLFFTFAGPGQGAAMSVAAAHRFHPDRPENVGGLFVKFAPGANQASFHSLVKRRVGNVFWLPREESPQVHNLGGIGNVPLLLAGIVALMAAATLAHTLITSIRRRRLDLAILKTLGFVRRQVSATVAWQATALGSVALLIGLPLGVISGRWGWNVFADRLGVVPSVAVPIIAILVAVPVTILVANLLAAVPGRIASRLRPGPVLRSE